MEASVEGAFTRSSGQTGSRCATPGPRPGRDGGAAAVALAQRPLDHDAVRPMAELERHRGQHADAAEAAMLVQPQRRLVAPVDVADHLAIAARRAGFHQRRQQQPADAHAGALRVDVDRVLQRVAVGRPFAERHRVGITRDLAVEHRHEMGQPLRPHVAAAALQVLGIDALDLVGADVADAAPDVVGIDRHHGGHVEIRRGADHQGPSGEGRRFHQNSRGRLRAPARPSSRIT